MDDVPHADPHESRRNSNALTNLIQLPQMQVIHVEYYDLREAHNAAKAIDGLIIAGSRIRIFGLPGDTDTQNTERAHTAKKSCIPFPKSSVEAVVGNGDKEDQSTQNASRIRETTTAQRKCRNQCHRFCATRFLPWHRLPRQTQRIMTLV